MDSSLAPAATYPKKKPKNPKPLTPQRFQAQIPDPSEIAPAQNPLIKESSLNHNMNPLII